VGLAAISYDPVEVLAAFASQHTITYPLLSDVGSVVIKRFGILNPVPERALGPGKMIRKFRTTFENTFPNSG
jgi:peroxiredoxin